MRLEGFETGGGEHPRGWFPYTWSFSARTTERNEMCRQQIAAPFVAILLFVATPAAGHAQVFIAAKPNPEFRIGPLFVSASVKRQDVTEPPGPVTVTVSWSLLPRRNRS